MSCRVICPSEGRWRLAGAVHLLIGQQLVFGVEPCPPVHVTPLDPTFFANFGRGVAVSQDVALIGAPDHCHAGHGSARHSSSVAMVQTGFRNRRSGLSIKCRVTVSPSAAPLRSKATLRLLVCSTMCDRKFGKSERLMCFDADSPGGRRSNCSCLQMAYPSRLQALLH